MLDERTVATGGFDSAIIVWDMPSGTARRVLRLHDSAVNVLLPAGRGCFLSGGEDGRLARWCDGLDRPRSEFREAHNGPVAALAVSPDGGWLASAAWDRQVRVWPLDGSVAAPAGLGAGGSIVEHRAPITGVGFLGGGRRIVSGGYDGEVIVSPLGPGAATRRSLLAALNGLATLPDGRIVLTAADGRVRVLDGDLVPSFEVELQDGPLNAVAASERGDVIAVAGMRTPVTLIDVATGTVVRQILGPGLPIWALAFSRDGTELYTGGADRALRRWAVATGLPVGDAIARPTESAEAQTQEEGARVFRACVACHAVKADDGHRAGPSLHGIIGRRIATAPGYAYSDALKRMDIVWTTETIARLFEVGPSVFTPGTKMPEQRITDPGDRQALVDWLARVTRP